MVTIFYSALPPSFQKGPARQDTTFLTCAFLDFWYMDDKKDLGIIKHFDVIMFSTSFSK